jgi:hypothetical protein
MQAIYNRGILDRGIIAHQAAGFTMKPDIKGYYKAKLAWPGSPAHVDGCQAIRRGNTAPFWGRMGAKVVKWTELREMDAVEAADIR